MFHAEARRRGEQHVHESFAPYTAFLRVSAPPREKSGTQTRETTSGLRREHCHTITAPRPLARHCRMHPPFTIHFPEAA